MSKEVTYSAFCCTESSRQTDELSSMLVKADRTGAKETGWRFSW